MCCVSSHNSNFLFCSQEILRLFAGSNFNPSQIRPSRRVSGKFFVCSLLCTRSTAQCPRLGAKLLLSTHVLDVRQSGPQFTWRVGAKGLERLQNRSVTCAATQVAHERPFHLSHWHIATTFFNQAMHFLNSYFLLTRFKKRYLETLMMTPGVQYPHWVALPAAIAACTFPRPSAVLPRPSTVVICHPLQASTGTKHCW